MAGNMDLWLKPSKLLDEVYGTHINNYDPIFHYTSCDGLMGIINEQNKLSFWFTRSDCLNDTMEGRFIQSIFAETCHELLDTGLIEEDFYKLIIYIKPSSKGVITYPIDSTVSKANSKFSVTSVGHTNYDDYICCFSMKNDSLDMWRYYSKNGDGYSLKLCPLMFERYKDFEFTKDKNRTYSNLNSFFVVYDHAEQINKTKAYILAVFNAYKNGGWYGEDRKTLTIYNIQQFFEKYRYVFKHECFSSEKEYRFVYKVPKTKPNNMTNPLPEVKYRAKDGVLIPYIVVDIEYADNYLEEVVISPFVKEENVINRTIDYLHSKGFSTNNVKKSELPVR